MEAKRAQLRRMAPPPGNLWNPMAPHGALKSNMELAIPEVSQTHYEARGSSVETSVKAHGAMLCLMEPDGAPCITLEPYGGPWEPHGALWNPMEANGPYGAE